jgi:hypothetical protein
VGGPPGSECGPAPRTRLSGDRCTACTSSRRRGAPGNLSVPELRESTHPNRPSCPHARGRRAPRMPGRLRKPHAADAPMARGRDRSSRRPSLVVQFDVPGSGVEPEAGEGAEAGFERIWPGPVEDEVEMGDSDVVRPDVDLFHGPRTPGENLSYPPDAREPPPARDALTCGVLPRTLRPRVSSAPVRLSLRVTGIRRQSPDLPRVVPNLDSGPVPWLVGRVSLKGENPHGHGRGLSAGKVSSKSRTGEARSHGPSSK